MQTYVPWSIFSVVTLCCTHPKQLEDNQQGNCSHGKFTLTEGRLITLLLLCGEARYKMSGPGVR